MASALLLLVLALPVAGAAACAVAADRRIELVPRLSNYCALTLAVVVSVAVADVSITVPFVEGRALSLSPAAQLGIQLMALSMVGLSLAVARSRRSEVVPWLPLA